MKALVAYYSESGNTEKLAKAVYEGINLKDKGIEPIGEAKAKDCDVIFIGFPVQASSVPAKVEQFIKSIPEGKMLAFFVTHGLAKCLAQGNADIFHRVVCIDMQVPGGFDIQIN